VSTQDPDNLGNVTPGDRKGNRPIVRVIKREQRTIKLGIPHRIGNGFNRLSIEGFYPQPFKHPASCLPQQSNNLGELVEVKPYGDDGPSTGPISMVTLLRSSATRTPTRA
jgi:hypothetical protein